MTAKQGSRTRRTVAALFSLFALAHPPAPAPAGTADPRAIPGGELQILAPGGAVRGACPLKHTDVEADISGFVARVRVRQTFRNPLPEKIEAVYVFPLPHDAAVDRMTMTVGLRHIVGRIEKRDDARRIYEVARAAGHVTSLLDQERPNIFTQSLANLEPGETVVIEIAYVETLRYQDGLFEFVFPTVVGPRYMPGAPVGRQGTGWAPDTTAVPDASRLSPPVAPPETRAGHDIRLSIDIDSGGDLQDVESETHPIDVRTVAPGRATVTLAERDVLPNRDFVLRYRNATDEIGDGLLLHQDARGTYFTLILQPPRRVDPREAVPKEMIFVIDRSGSMEGFPIEKAKDTMRLAIAAMNPRDTFNLLSFAGGTGRCFERPMPNTPENRAVALRYLADLSGSGGTEMMPAIHAALAGEADPERLRVVAFMTDGYIGNDFEIIDAVGKNAGTARVFAFGIGSAVNRFLLDGMALAGRGEAEFVHLESDADAAVERFHERIHAPVLTDIEIDWGDLPVADVYPRRFPDLFSAEPLMIHGRLTGMVPGSITLRGKTAAGGFERRIEVSPLEDAGQHDALASLWARAVVEDLMMRDYAALQSGTFPEEIRDEVTRLGLEFGLMTQFTSFVAVEEMTVTLGGEPKTIAVPVEMPSGVSYEGVFGEADAMRAIAPAGAVYAAAKRAAPAQERANAVRGDRGMAARDEEKAAAALPPRDKLAEALRDLAARVEREGTHGTLSAGDLRVVDYRLDVMVHLQDSSPNTLAALRKVGFLASAEATTAHVMIGRIDVRKLDELAKLDAVLAVEPIDGRKRGQATFP